MTTAAYVRVGTAVGMLVTILVATAGCGSDAPDDSGPAAVVHTSHGDGGSLAGTEVEPGFPFPAATLTADDGSRVRLDRALDRPVTVFFFGYTHCPDICPLIMSDLSLAVSRLPDDVRNDVQVAFVTSDPTRDTPEALRTYLDRFDPDFAGFTGDLDTIVDVAETMGIAVEQGQRLPSGGFEVAHGAELVGYVGDEGVVIWNHGTSVEDLAADLAALVAEAQTIGGGREG